MKFTPLAQCKIAALLSAAFVLLGCEAPSTTASEQAPPIYPGVVAPIQPELVTVITNSSAPTNAEVIDEAENAIIKPVELSAPLKEVVKLAQSGVGDDVILAYVQNSPVPFNPTPDEILYLTDLGISDVIVTALVNHRSQQPQAAQPGIAVRPAPEPVTSVEDPSPPATAEATYNPEPQVVYSSPPVVQYVTPPPVVEYNYFQASLSPYGNWVDVPNYGVCWQPTVAVVNRGWRPYSDRGRWLNTDSGWYWQSDYSWGWAPFHYGRWFSHPSRGWCWRPDSVWGPAWVSWRYTDSYCGWAPLPPGAHFRSGGGISYYGASVGVSFGFGLRRDAWTFVPARRMHDREVWRHRLGRSEQAAAFGRSHVVNNYIVNNNTIINRGIGPDRVPAIGRSEPRKISIRDLPERSGHTVRPDRLHQQGSDLVVYRPKPPVVNPRTPNNQPDASRPIHSLGGRATGSAPSFATPSQSTGAAAAPSIRPRSEAPPASNFGRNQAPESGRGIVNPPPSTSVGRQEVSKPPGPVAGEKLTSPAPTPGAEAPRINPTPVRRSFPGANPSFSSPGQSRPVTSFTAPTDQSRRAPAFTPPAAQPGSGQSFTAPAPQSTPAPSYSAPAVQSRPLPSYSAPAVQSRPAPSYSAPAVQSRPAPTYAAPAVRSRPAPSYSAPAVQSRPTPSYSAPAPSRPVQSYSAPAAQSRPSYSAPAASAPASRPAQQSRSAPAQSERSNTRR